MHLGFVFLAIAIVTISVGAWNPPFPYRQGYVPARAIVARVDFEVEDEKLTLSKRVQAGREVLWFYKNDVKPLVQLRGGVRDFILRYKTSAGYDTLNEEQKNALNTVASSQNTPTGITSNVAYDAIKALLVDDTQIEKLDTALNAVFKPMEETGLMENLQHSMEEGNQRAIRVLTPGMEDTTEVDVKRVRHVDVIPILRENLAREIKKQFNSPDAAMMSELIFQYMSTRLPTTLEPATELTQKARVQREAEVKPVMIHYFPSLTTMVSGGNPLSIDDLELLHAEYDAWVANQSLWENMVRLLSYVGMLLAICVLCGLYIYFQLDQGLLTDTRRLVSILGLSVACILLAVYAAQDPWRARVLPLVFCAMTATIVFGRSIALILLTVLSLAITITLGMDLAEFVISLSVCAASILMLGRIRSQKKPVYVALGAALVVAATTLGVGTLMGQVNGISQDPEQMPLVSAVASKATSITQTMVPPLFTQLAWEAVRHALFTVLAGIILAGLLPSVEYLFDVQTDLSLLLIGDATSHALLRQLAQRAPGTFNHSITVAVIAEAAADSIGANGLLTRVGAHFHDIGKMFKPNYFIENQSHGVNCHDTLQPAMSTLVIIAHVKDGADLARQHKLPKSLIDFIEQHHGTTLVEYFYRQAAKKSEETSAGSSQVLEATFRYPGPKPQTLEAAVLMIADAVESASRTLVEPTPAKLQNLIESISMKKLTDGQFDECGLTLAQLNVIKTSVLKTLTSIYHHRVKYDQESA
jgi:putative nucleotidyltransferase with HDIG domain